MIYVKLLDLMLSASNPTGRYLITFILRILLQLIT
jgi:hypothetical protein